MNGVDLSAPRREKPKSRIGLVGEKCVTHSDTVAFRYRQARPDKRNMLGKHGHRRR